MMALPRTVPPRWAVFGRRLQELRKANNLSQVELGKEFDMTDVQISRLETGKSGTSFENVMRLEERLGARSGELVGIAFPIGKQETLLSPEEREILDVMHRIPEHDKRRLVSIARAFAA